MGFNLNDSTSTARNQEELVAERTESKPELLEEELTYPGIQVIHMMMESELVELFKMVLKSRPSIYELDLTLGDYKYAESIIKVPKSDSLASCNKETVAIVLTNALKRSGQNCVGIRAEIKVDAKGNASSYVYKKIAERPAQGHTYDDNGNIVEEGDSEFNPKIVVTYRP